MTKIFNLIMIWWYGEGLCFIRSCPICRREAELPMAKFNITAPTEFTTQRRHNGILEQVAIQHVICSEKCQIVADYRAERIALTEKISAEYRAQLRR